MSETGPDFPKPPTPPEAPQIGPRDVGYHPRQEFGQPEPTPAQPSAPEQQRGGLINRLTGVGKRIADTLSATPEPKLLPEQINAQTVGQRMESVHDDRTLLGFTEDLQMEWLGYRTRPNPESPEYQQWLLASEALRRANMEFDLAGITQQGSLTMPSGEKVPARKVTDTAKFKQLIESKPVMQAHPQGDNK